jgi:hypothetical protein
MTGVIGEKPENHTPLKEIEESEREREREMIRKVTATRELTHQSTDLGL